MRNVGRRDQRCRARRARGEFRARRRRHGARVGQLCREPGLSLRRLDDVEDELALARGRNPGRPRRAQSGVAARQRAAARAARAKRALRRHSALDRPRTSTPSRSRPRRMRRLDPSRFFRAGPTSLHGRACAASAAQRGSRWTISWRAPPCPSFSRPCKSAASSMATGRCATERRYPRRSISALTAC